MIEVKPDFQTLHFRLGFSGADRVLAVRVHPPDMRCLRAARIAHELADIRPPVSTDRDARRDGFGVDGRRQGWIAEVTGLDRLAGEPGDGHRPAMLVDPDDVVAGRVGDEDLVRRRAARPNGLDSLRVLSRIVVGIRIGGLVGVDVEDGRDRPVRRLAIQPAVSADAPASAIGRPRDVDQVERAGERPGCPVSFAFQDVLEHGAGGCACEWECTLADKSRTWGRGRCPSETRAPRAARRCDPLVPWRRLERPRRACSPR